MKEKLTGCFAAPKHKMALMSTPTVSIGSLDREVNKHGWAGWQGNKISSKETTRGTLHREVNKKAV